MTKDEMRKAIIAYKGLPSYESTAWERDRSYSDEEVAYLEAVAQLTTEVTQAVEGAFDE